MSVKRRLSLKEIMFTQKIKMRSLKLFQELMNVFMAVRAKIIYGGG